jgi:two-component system, response regulator PdtaR
VQAPILSRWSPGEPAWLLPHYAPQDEGAGTSPSARRVLLVEDEYFIAVELEYWLSEAGHEVVAVATRADEAIAAAQANLPDLVVMDIRLKGLADGIEAAREIYSQLGIRCLFATAHPDVRARIRAAPSQPLGWLAKPFDRDTFMRAFAAALDSLGKP